MCLNDNIQVGDRIKFFIVYYNGAKEIEYGTIITIYNDSCLVDCDSYRLNIQKEDIISVIKSDAK